MSIQPQQHLTPHQNSHSCHPLIYFIPTLTKDNPHHPLIPTLTKDNQRNPLIRLIRVPTVGNMGRLGFEPKTDRLKAECSTAELATRCVFSHTISNHSMDFWERQAFC